MKHPIWNSTLSADGTISDNWGLYNHASSGTYTVTVDSTRIVATWHTVRTNDSYIVQIGASQLVGGDVSTLYGGTITCIACYDENYANAGGYNSCP